MSNDAHEYAIELTGKCQVLLQTGRNLQNHLRIPHAPTLDEMEKLIVSIQAVSLSRDISPVRKIDIIKFMGNNMIPLADNFRSTCREWNLSVTD